MRLPPITKYFYILFLVCGTWLSKAQTGAIVDQIAGVVGDNIILQSEIEVEFEQLKKEQAGVRDSFKCEVMRSKLIEKLMLCKAQIDSVEINEDRVDYELEKRIRFFAMQFSNGAGIEQGQKNMEEFYGKPISQIKSDNREKIKQSMLVQEIQGKILKDVKVSPTDIKKYFAELEKTDSLPYYSAEVEVAQIIIEPKVTAEAKAIAYQKILELRNRIISGENFRTLALIYTDDKASASKGGELGFFSRGDMVPEFEATAFKLKPDSVSKIIETKYGYHILQLIDRKGDNINVRHILVRPQLFRSDLSRAKEILDSILWLIKIDSISFENAAKKFSDDAMTRSNGGFITQGGSGNTKVPIDELDKDLYYNIEKMDPGNFSDPEVITLPGPDKQQAWRVLYLKSESPPHKCNLADDYQKLQALAFERKQKKALRDWITKYRKQIYFRVSPEYQNCSSISEFINK